MRASHVVKDDLDDSSDEDAVCFLGGCSGSCLKSSKNFWISGSTGSFGAVDCSEGGGGAGLSFVCGFEDDDDQSQPIVSDLCLSVALAV